MTFIMHFLKFFFFRFGADDEDLEAYIGVGDGDVRVYHGSPPNGQNVTFQIRITKIEDPATHKVSMLELLLYWMASEIIINKTSLNLVILRLI